MLFVYPLIILCFNLINVDCDVRRTNSGRSSRRLVVSGDSNVSDPLDNIGISASETPILSSNNLEVKRNVTRVRKYKRRKVPLNVDKLVENVAEITTPRNEEPESFHIKTNFHLQSNVKGVIKPNTASNKIEAVLEPTTVRAQVKVVEKKVVTEKPTERSSVSTSTPRTFTKRPPEFNPVFKKRRERDPVVRIVNEKNFVYGHNGNFHYSFEGDDGTKVYSKGKLISHEERKAGEAVEGGYYYKDAEGNDYSLSYTADQNGYRPVGAHLPTPPPIPPEIARALEYLATKPTPEPVTDKYWY